MSPKEIRKTSGGTMEDQEKMLFFTFFFWKRNKKLKFLRVFIIIECIPLRISDPFSAFFFGRAL